ncbi:DUF305 domain-containing protein [Streptomyces sp. LP05-1]|uniref:DUF305 domain-containing protein n=1 Tax=Streptomyces pyxinae TaxID=2970734 RepID=A0ABT2CNP4_9ACTN|nr:DUF305 domain-containing protein [Streptomyces sp. LP05-1]MCS0638925.1 DUF305 domain-containing protein [Streptomyces sp. LP05-1]
MSARQAWWEGSRTRWAAVTAVVLALLFAGAATVASARDGAAPERPVTPAADSVEAGFARDMAVHHQQAVEMSFLVRDLTDDEEIRRLAYDIANTQANQRGMLLGWLDLWGLPKVAMDREPMGWMGMPSHGASAPGAPMPGMASRAQLAELRASKGRQAEIGYLRLMTAHHKGGVHMARGCAEKCATPVERELAQGMVDAQESEIALMAELLRKRGVRG